jgi:hypothetical protein|tara:strand:- start:1029 stop:1271 length:243 start_codon:yes stop_codon:yes gene_type:complete
MSAEDTLAVCILAILAVAGVTLMTILCSLMKNAGKRDELAELLNEETESHEEPREETAGGECSEEESRELWEKDSEWWKG